MDKNNFSYCTFLLVDEYNHSRTFISEENKYYIKRDNKSIHLHILNEFEDIKKSYGINVYDITNNYCYKIDDITDNYYKIDKPHIIKNCTILLIEDDDHSKIFISEKNLYYTSNDCNDFGVDVDDYIFNDYEFFDEDYGDYDYCDDYYDNYDYYYYYCKHDDNDYDYCDYYYYDDDDDDDDFYNKLYYKKPLNYFERLVSVKNNIVNATSNGDYNQNITLIINNLRMYIL